MSADEAKVEHEAERLTRPDWMSDVATGDRSRTIQAEISNAMVGLKKDFVGLKKDFYGKGPTKAKTFLNDNYVFCAMEGGLTRNEEVLIAAGKADLVRSYRLAFQETVTQTSVKAVEDIVGRRVVNYHSQIVFEPTRAFEIFVLESAPEQG